jgi:hypothetical protein
MADSWVFTNRQKMSPDISGKVTRNVEKTWYIYEWGKGPGERKAAGIFTYTKPKGQVQKGQNFQALQLLELPHLVPRCRQRSAVYFSGLIFLLWCPPLHLYP